MLPVVLITLLTSLIPVLIILTTLLTALFTPSANDLIALIPCVIFCLAAFKLSSYALFSFSAAFWASSAAFCCALACSSAALAWALAVLSASWAACLCLSFATSWALDCPSTLVLSLSTSSA